ncbi:carbohydrate ABC transporter permease [Sphaerochaeta halotolerans]|jgi:alpha-1,4-digalacturonate transport system permease protein|uniref:Sugar ABC transporter permease n=1 Tax=Sphaerochaeta halotolerans TaxID=2293840 RepID=A0A372MDZ1_9SPIR|nr:sugar ABC transporter permease [Sphaerochaeta halotolerans]MBG0767451.1 sugar ABC transporter permease [Spirochaetaceae bacterium]MXI87488.1 ABC transporter permease subunit [Sphaerochaeta halotolerans]RFU94009.1 sugar ABC transporter permease [Sphaerochaeta halotolerans]
MKTPYVKRHVTAFWFFIAPCLILFSVFFLLPLCLSVGLSLTNYDGWKTMDFIGLHNYTELVRDSKFYDALGRTFGYTLFSLPFKVIVPLLIAILVTSKRVAIKGLARTMVYVPSLLSHLVVGITINWMFSAEYGLVNYLIGTIGGEPMQWALNPRLATFVISFASNWASTGFYMVIFIGGITNISSDIYEAAAIDGSSPVQTFFHMTLPMLAPTTFLVTLLSTVNLLKEYALVQGITQGGPGLNTTFIIQFIFDKGFNQMQYGYASAISLLVMIIFAFIAFVQFKISNGGDK